MRRSTRSRLVAAVIAPLVLFGAAACGGKDAAAPDSSADGTKASADGSAGSDSGTSGDSGSDSGSASGSDSGSAGSDSSSGGQVLTEAEFRDMVGKGAPFKTLHMTLSGKSEGKKIAGDIDMDISDLKHPAMRMAMQSGGEAFEMILVEDAVYLGKPGSSEPYLKMTGGDSPVPFDLKKNESNFVEAILGDAQVTKIVYVGDEDINGVSTKHFRLAAKGEKPMQLWLDADGRPAQMTMVQDGAPVRIAFSHFDEAVDITAPKNFQELPSQ